MFKALTCLLMLAALPVQAADTPVQRLRNFLSRASSLEAEFVQVQVDEKGNPGKRSSGVFHLQRPGKFRWDYQKPYNQQIVSSGDKVWFYDKDLEQVTARKLGQAIGSTPALLLSGEVPIEQNFTIENQTIDEGLYWLKLVPKSEEGGFKYVLLGLEGDSLAGMELSDNFGQLTRIYFKNVKTGVKQDAALFAFSPPPGVDVFEDK
ncbi:MAG: outer membrane lipoprotein chaperone LolA [Methylococcaceae bacterium]